MSELIHCVYFSDKVRSNDGWAPGYGAYSMEDPDIYVKPRVDGSPPSRLARELIVSDELLAQHLLRPGWLRSGVFMPSYTIDNSVLWWALRTVSGDSEKSPRSIYLHMADERFLPSAVSHARDSLA